MANKFLVSVANAILRNPTTGAAIAVGKTNIDSSITMSTQKTEVRGGIGNPVLYTYFHDKNVEFKITQATFDKNVIALNAGVSITNGSITIVQSDDITLVAGDGTLTQTPSSATVTVFLPNGTSQVVTPVGTAITVTGGLNQSVTAVYTYTGTGDQVIYDATTPPSVVDLTLISNVYNESGVLVEYFQVNVPNYQIDGNYALTLNANGVSDQALNGVANVTTGTGGDPNYYFKAAWIPVSTTAVPVSAIACTPSVLTFSVAAGLPKAKQINTLGIRGGTYANATITTSCSYVRTSGCVTFTVGAGTGIVTASSAVGAGDACLITATHYDATSGSLTDTVNVAVTA